MTSKFRERLLTALCLLMAAFPWTILLLRIYFQWALDCAQIMIPCYAVLMMVSCPLTALCCRMAGKRSVIMTVCQFINTAYAVFGAAVLGLIAMQKYGIW